MSSQRVVIALLMVCALFVLGASTLGLPLGVLRVPLGLVVALFTTGYGLLLVVRPRHIAASIRAILSVPLSLAIAAIVGLLLNSTAFGAHVEPFATALACLAVILLGIGWLRSAGGMAAAPAWRTAALPAPGIGALALVALLVGVASWAGYGIVRASNELAEPFTELYISELTAASLSALPGPASVQLGVNNREAQAIDYTLRVFTQAPAQATVLVAEQQIHVAEGQRWQGAVAVSINCGSLIEAELWLANGKTPYRQVQARPTCAPAVAQAITPAPASTIAPTAQSVMATAAPTAWATAVIPSATVASTPAATVTVARPSPSPMPTSATAEQAARTVLIYQRELAKGVRGPRVNELQQRLRELGYFTQESNTDFFGDFTAEALAQFQTRNGLPASGRANKATIELLNRCDQRCAY